MNDLEICKRIAEIEKLPHRLEEGMNDKFINTSTIYGDVCEYNPLTDDALCFQLMIKYCVDFNHAMFTDDTLHRYQAVNTITGKGFGLDKNPNKAICLAIIKIYK